jgi:hypothetical protein
MAATLRLVGFQRAGLYFLLAQAHGARMAYRLRFMAALAALLALPDAALAANAVATRPASIHAAPDARSKVIGLIGVSQLITAKNCRKGWCAAAGGYVQSSDLRFGAYDDSYVDNVPLALPPYGYTPGFWGFGGRRYYDRYGNYAKYGPQGYAGPPSDFDTQPAETIPRRGLFGAR